MFYNNVAKSCREWRDGVRKSFAQEIRSTGKALSTCGELLRGLTRLPQPASGTTFRCSFLRIGSGFGHTIPLGNSYHNRHSNTGLQKVVKEEMAGSVDLVVLASVGLVGLVLVALVMAEMEMVAQFLLYWLPTFSPGSRTKHRLLELWVLLLLC